ncbi:MAG: RNA polymerase sigma-70 factor [Candidatus Pseudobacter hemicellulosilyticus]|uniref:RNA polymerase sigma-70 factor n=1 Tax=Candidatus Pseudobacter hemicellulosilyticus TaxID=3121375 RepID=A0AAJ5WYE4_9BACT|nr:MAG: RNA polymerase sigma-70 factor [Pseudobacter sp.]
MVKNACPINELSRDKTLFSRIAGGDTQAFSELFRLYYDPLRWNAGKLLQSAYWAEEIIQEVFLQLWAHRSDLPLVEQPAAYLYRITANRSFDRIRRQSREVQAQYLLQQAGHSGETEQQHRYDLVRLQQLVQQAVDSLPEQQRIIYLLQQEQELSYQEMADRLGLSRNTVRNHLARALQNIRAYLQEHADPLTLLLLAWLFH